MESSALDEITTWRKIPSRTDFIYSDLDNLENELGEIYGYYELTSLSYNAEVFHKFLLSKQLQVQDWLSCDMSTKSILIEELLDSLEQLDQYKQHDALLALNYLVQGCWQDLETEDQQLKCIEDMTMIIIHSDGFHKLNTMLLYFMRQIEAFSVPWEWWIMERLFESCLIVLCTVTSIVLLKEENETVKDFLAELRTSRGDNYIITAIEGFGKILGKLSPRSFLLKKQLVYIRNLILLSAGDLKQLRKVKDECRVKAGLLPCKEDTVLHCRNIEIIQKLPCWNGLQGSVNLMPVDEFIERVVSAEDVEQDSIEINKSLPWTPKSGLENLQECMTECNWHRINNKCGVPGAVQQRCEALLKHLYVPLSVFQLEEERLIKQYPSVVGGQESPFVERTDAIFSCTLVLLEQFISILTIVLSEAIPGHPRKGKLAFVPRCGGEEKFYVEDSKREAEIIVKTISAIFLLLLKHTKVNHIEQFECIAVQILGSCFISSGLRFFNRDITGHLRPGVSFQHPHCPFQAINVDLTLARVNVNSMNHLSPQEDIISWRNSFSHVNLLRIFVKLVKGKPSRILILNMFKAQHCFKRCLSVRDSLLQQYALKLLKLQCKFLDPEWKRDNQRIISAIYHKVRHRLLDNWIGEISCSGRVKKRPEIRPKTKKWPWEYNPEEMAHQEKVAEYIERKFIACEGAGDNKVDEKCDLSDLDGIASELKDWPLPKEFLEKYPHWLEMEVFGRNVNWDSLVTTSSL